MAEGSSPRKLGPLAYAIGFAFIIAGVSLYQSVLRHYIPPLTIGDGWYDWSRGLGAAVFGGVSGLVGSVIGYLIERCVRG